MLYVYLAVSGARIVLPNAVRLSSSAPISLAVFVDADGEPVAIFRRSSVIAYSKEPLAELEDA